MTPQKHLQRTAAGQLSGYSRARKAGLGLLGMVTLSAFSTIQAFAQTASTNGIGAQAQNMAQETSTTGGFIGSTAMYAAALITFVGGVWALWQSRQAQSREGGKVALGITGLVLTGLFATGGVWINKAANTASGGDASVSSTSQAVTFGNQ